MLTDLYCLEEITVPCDPAMNLTFAEFVVVADSISAKSGAYIAVTTKNGRVVCICLLSISVSSSLFYINSLYLSRSFNFSDTLCSWRLLFACIGIGAINRLASVPSAKGYGYTLGRLRGNIRRKLRPGSS